MPHGEVETNQSRIVVFLTRRSDQDGPQTGTPSVNAVNSVASVCHALNVSADQRRDVPVPPWATAPNTLPFSANCHETVRRADLNVPFVLFRNGRMNVESWMTVTGRPNYASLNYCGGIAAAPQSSAYGQRNVGYSFNVWKIPALEVAMGGIITTADVEICCGHGVERVGMNSAITSVACKRC